MKKKLFPFFLVILLIFSSCKKEELDLKSLDPTTKISLSELKQKLEQLSQKHELRIQPNSISPLNSGVILDNIDTSSIISRDEHIYPEFYRMSCISALAHYHAYKYMTHGYHAYPQEVPVAAALTAISAARVITQDDVSLRAIPYEIGCPDLIEPISLSYSESCQDFEQYPGYIYTKLIQLLYSDYLDNIYTADYYNLIYNSMYYGFGDCLPIDDYHSLSALGHECWDIIELIQNLEFLFLIPNPAQMINEYTNAYYVDDEIEIIRMYFDYIYKVANVETYVDEFMNLIFNYLDPNSDEFKILYGSLSVATHAEKLWRQQVITTGYHTSYLLFDSSGMLIGTPTSYSDLISGLYLSTTKVYGTYKTNNGSLKDIFFFPNHTFCHPALGYDVQFFDTSVFSNNMFSSQGCIIQNNLTIEVDGEEIEILQGTYPYSILMYNNDPIVIVHYS